MSGFDDFMNAKPAELPLAPKASAFDKFMGVEPRSALGEIGNQLAAGAVVELPQQIGKALQYTGERGDTLYDAGTKIRQFGDEREHDYEPQPDAHNVVTNALAGGARMIAPSIAPAAAIAGGIAALPVAVPAAATAGIAALGTGAVFGAAQGQETYEKGIKAGLPEERAKEAGRINALIEGGGETLGTLALGKLFGVAGKAVSRASGRSAAEATLDAAKDTSVIKPWLKSIPETAAIETGTEIGQNAGEAAIEKAYGIDKQDPVEAGIQAIAPTLGMTALLAPFGLAGHSLRARAVQQRMDVLADPATEPETRAAYAGQIGKELEAVDKGAAAAWRENARQRILAGQPITIDDAMLAVQPGGGGNAKPSEPGAAQPSPGDTAAAGPGAVAPAAGISGVDSGVPLGGPENPIARDSAGQSVHPEDVAAQAAAAQPGAGPVERVAGLTTVPPAGGPSATEQARTAQAATVADQAQESSQAAQESQQEANATAEVQRRAGVLASVLANKSDLEPTATFAKLIGAEPSPDELKAIRHELTLREQKAKEEQAAADAGKTSMQLALEAAQAKKEAADAKTLVEGGSITGQKDKKSAKKAAATPASVALSGATPEQQQEVAKPAAGAPALITTTASPARPESRQAPTHATGARVEAPAKESSNAGEIDRTTQVGEQPGGAEGVGTSGRQGVERGVQGPLAAEAGQAAAQDRAPAVAPRQTVLKGPMTPVDQAAHEAATSPRNSLSEPTEGQREAENFQMGHPRIAGMDVTIKNPAGTKRFADAKPLTAHYGHIRGTVAADKSQLDAFVKPGTPENYAGPVFVIDQHNAFGKYDEGKTMIGWPDEASARAGYLENYPKGWRGLSGIKQFSMDEFKAWLASGKTHEPVAPVVKALPAPKPSVLAAKRQPSGQLYVELGDQRYAVKDFADASEKFERFRDQAERADSGGSELPIPKVVDETGREVARLSYNGRVWGPGEWKPGDVPLYDNRRPEQPKGVVGADRRPTSKAERVEQETPAPAYKATLIVQQAIDHVGGREAFERAIAEHFRELADEGETVPADEAQGEIEAVADDLLSEWIGDKRPLRNVGVDFEAVPELVGKEFPAKAVVMPSPKKTVALGKDVPTITQAEADQRIAEWKAEVKRIGETQDNSKKVIISLFDRTGIWSRPYKEAGYTVIQYDLAHGDDLMKHFPIADIRNIQEAGLEVVGVIAQPPCTSFAVSGARWWATQHDRPDEKMVAKKYGDWAAVYFDKPVEVAETLVHVAEAVIEFANPSQFYVLENPVGRIAKIAGLPKPTATFNPNAFGNPYTKKTLLWGEFNTDLPTAHVEPTEGSKIAEKLRGTNELDKLERSATPEGFAYAFFMANHEPGQKPAAEPSAPVQTAMDLAQEPSATPAHTATEPRAADAAAVSAEDFDKLVDEVFAQAPTPPAPTKAQIIPTRAGILVQPIDDLGNPVGDPHQAGEKPKEEPAPTPTKATGELEEGDRVVIAGDGPNAGRHGTISKKTALVMRSVFGGASSERSVHYTVKTDGGVEVYAGPDDLESERERPSTTVPDIQIEGRWDTPESVLRSVGYLRRSANNARAAASRARLDSKKTSLRAEAEKYDRQATAAQAAFDVWAAAHPDAAAPLLPQAPKAPVAPATTQGTAEIPAMTMVSQKHGKTGEQLYIVNMNERHPRDVFERMRDRAKEFGGYYSNFAGARGFTFRTEDAARRFMGQQAPAENPVETPVKTGSQILDEAAQHAGAGLKAGFAGLDALFGRKGTLGSGPVFDEDTWQQAKPHFQAAFAEFVAAGKSLREFVVHIRDTYNASIIPYLKRWHQELQQETDHGRAAERTATAEDDRGSDAGQGAGDVREPAGERTAGADDQRAREPVSDAARQGTQQGPDEVDRGEQSGAPGGEGERPGRGSAKGARGGSGGRARVPARRKPGLPAGISDYHPEPGSLIRTGGWKRQAGINLDIIELVKKLEAENRLATPEEQALLSKWTGWGASELAQNLFVGPRYTGKLELNSGWAKKDEWRPLIERAKALMTPEEVDAAARSTQYAHYTSEPVIRAMWDALARLGFKGGRIFEPGMGTGLFAVLGPAATLKDSVYTGIEFEPFTAKIAKYLLPEQNVVHGDYTKYKAPPAFFDLAVGNPPFAKTAILTDPEYKKFRFALHDYFFAKTIDRIRPGGIMAFVTSAFTMDKATDTARKYLAERADLVGAIRLPNTAFLANAGTEVVTDVLFFQRRAPGQEPGGPAWAGLKPVTTGGKEFMVNEYFVDHPEMVLGAHSKAGKMYAAETYTVEPTGDLATQLAAAIAKLPENIVTERAAPTEKERETFERDMSPTAKKEGQVYVGDDGNVYRREFGTGRRLEELRKGVAEREWFKSYVGLRDALKQARYDQLTDGEWEKSLKALNKTYDAFVKKHGHLLDFTEHDVIETDEDGNERTVTERRYKNQKRFEVDVEGPLVAALEAIDQNGKIKKGPFLLDRVLAKPEPPKIETVHDALAVSLSDVGRLDLAHVAGLIGKSVDDVIADLGDLIYYAPAGEWQLADEYLSGNVVDKLAEARAAASVDKAYERNVVALEKAQPKPLAAADISIGLGVSWIPTQYYDAFAAEVLNIATNVHRSAIGTWAGVEAAAAAVGKRKNATRTAARQEGEWSTDKRSAGELFDAAINSRTIKITYTGSDKRTYTDAEGSAAANDKVKKMREAFGRWIWQDSQRAADLLDLYNSRFNNIADREFNGEHLRLPGLSLRYTLYPHQKRAIWRAIQTGNTYFAHAVGAGKTLEMIVSAMEQRRLGLIRTPMFAVPRHMLNQFAAEFLDAYPAADVMVASPENFGKENRKRFVAQAAMNKPDAIVISHPAFGLIKPDPAMKQKVLDDLIGEMQAALEELDDRHDRAQQRTRKQIEQRIEQLEQRFLSKTAIGDDLVTLDEMGVDFLYVDEAHEFRKLDFVTNRQNVKGITPEGSRRALDLYIKVKALDAKRPGRSHIFASGTPITNTLGELYSIQRFMDEDALAKDGMTTFDDWASQFGEVDSYDERNAAGSYEVVERFAKFVNVPELMSRVRSFMDVLTFSQLKDLISVPAIKGGAPQIVLSEITPALQEYMQGLNKRIEVSRKWKPSKDEPGNPDPLINIITDARLASIDTAFVRAGLSNPKSKLNKMIDGIIAEYKATKGNTYTTDGKTDPLKGGTQIVFSAVGFGTEVAKNRGFDVRQYIERRLTKAGVQTSEIAWMSDYANPSKKEAMFRAMREGRIRILFGSPKNMGTGVNVQKRLTSEHYLSPPWYPADEEQPRGRIVRQGNQNSEVKVEWYATKETYDSTQWQMIARKQRFIERALTGSRDVRRLDDISEASQYEQASALASGDERVIRYSRLKRDIDSLDLLNRAHAESQSRLRRDARWTRSSIESHEAEVKRLESGIAAGAGKYLSTRDTDGVIAGKPVKSAHELGEAVLAEVRRVLKASPPTDAAEPVRFAIGTLNGAEVRGVLTMKEYKKEVEFNFGVGLRWGNFTGRTLVTHNAQADFSSHEITALGSAILGGHYDVQEELNRETRDLAEKRERLTEIEAQIGVPFDRAQEYAEKVAEAAVLREELLNTKAAQEASVPALEVEAAADAIEHGIDTGTWEAEGGRLPNEPEAVASGGAARGISALDRALYGAVATGETSVRVLLQRIVKESPSPLNRAIAALVLRSGVNAKIELGTLKGISFPVKDNGNFTAAYIPSKNTIRLIRPARVEQDIVHEAVHAATYAAIRKGGIAAQQMRVLYQHVKDFGMLDPEQYGLENIDEFMAEAFSNPEFQALLKAIPAKRGIGTVQNAWEWFVNIVRTILGMRPEQSNALSQVLEVGQALMAEGKEQAAAPREAALAARGKPLLVYHGTNADFGGDFRIGWNVGGMGEQNLGIFFGTVDHANDVAEHITAGQAHTGESAPNVIPVLLDLKNPLRVTKDAKYWFSPSRVLDALSTAIDVTELRRLVREHEAKGLTFTRDYKGSTDAFTVENDTVAEVIRPWLERQGYDGVIYPNQVDGENPTGDSYIAFRPEQARSVFAMPPASGRRESGAFDRDNPSIVFSGAPAAARTDFVTRVREGLEDAYRSQDTIGLWGKTVGTMRGIAYAKEDGRWKHPDFKRVYDRVQSFLESTSRFAMRAADLAQSVLPRTDNLAAAARNVVQARQRARDMVKVQDAIWKGTLIDQRVYGAEELKARGFTPAQVKMYQETRAAIAQSVRDLASTEMVRVSRLAGLFQEMDPHAGLDALHDYYLGVAQDQIDEWRAAQKGASKERTAELAARISAMQDTMITMRGLRDDAEQRLSEGYAPLMRFGRHVVDVYRVDDDGEIVRDEDGNADRLDFRMFDYERHANAAARELRKEYADQPDVVVVQSIVNPDAYQQFQGLSPETVQLFADRLGLDQNEVYREYLKLAVTQRSALQRMYQHRKGIAGFAEDLPRVLAAFITSNSRRASTNVHEGELGRAVKMVRNGEEQRMAQALAKYVRDPTEEAHRLRGFLFFNFLSGSIASALTNVTGGALMLAPYLQQFTQGRKDLNLARIMARAAKMAISGTDDPAMKRAAALAAQEGLTQPMEVHQLHAEAAGSALGRNPYLRSTLHVLAAPFAAAETFNRRLSFYAAWQIAQATNHPDPMKFAEDAIAATQGVYNKGNRPVWARGAIGATVFTFKQFAIAYGEFLMRLPLKQRTIALAALVVASGIRGLPFEEDLEDLIDTLLQALGFNFTTKKKLHEWATKVLGETGGQILLHGVSAIPGMPLDVQQRLGFGNMIPGTSILKRSETDRTRDALEALGPVGGLVKNVSTAASDVLAGNYAKAAKNASPVAVQNIIQAIDMGTTGYYNDDRGRRVAAVSFGDAITKGIGFQPQGVAAESRRVQEQYQTIAMQKDVEGDIVQKWAEGIQSKDQGKIHAALADLRAYNARNPEAPIRITPAQVQERVREMNLTRAQRFQRSAPPELRGAIGQALR